MCITGKRRDYTCVFLSRLWFEHCIAHSDYFVHVATSWQSRLSIHASRSFGPVQHSPPAGLKQYGHEGDEGQEGHEGHEGDEEGDEGEIPICGCEGDYRAVVLPSYIYTYTYNRNRLFKQAVTRPSSYTFTLEVVFLYIVGVVSCWFCRQVKKESIHQAMDDIITGGKSSPGTTTLKSKKPPLMKS